jgi:hypothetical protein
LLREYLDEREPRFAMFVREEIPPIGGKPAHRSPI